MFKSNVCDASWTLVGLRDSIFVKQFFLHFYLKAAHLPLPVCRNHCVTSHMSRLLCTLQVFIIVHGFDLDYSAICVPALLHTFIFTRRRRGPNLSRGEEDCVINQSSLRDLGFQEWFSFLTCCTLLPAGFSGLIVRFCCTTTEGQNLHLGCNQNFLLHPESVGDVNTQLFSSKPSKEPSGTSVFLYTLCEV